MIMLDECWELFCMKIQRYFHWTDNEWAKSMGKHMFSGDVHFVVDGFFVRQIFVFVSAEECGPGH